MRPLAKESNKGWKDKNISELFPSVVLEDAGDDGHTHFAHSSLFLSIFFHYLKT